MEAVYNWHITEHCQYDCHYCFAKWGKPDEIWRDNHKTAWLLAALKKDGAKPFLKFGSVDNIRLNFAGGEPLLLKTRFLEIVDLAANTGLTTSLITNGALLHKYTQLAAKLNMVGISIDSLDAQTNLLIGRHSRSKQVLTYAMLAKLVTDLRLVNPSIKIKFNVVVNRFNYQEALLASLLALEPYKIKILQELSAGPNVSQTSTEMLTHFINVNRNTDTRIVVEDNQAMTQSYLMIDPLGRFYQNGLDTEYRYSKPIQDVGLLNAIHSVGFDYGRFKNRYKGESHGS